MFDKAVRTIKKYHMLRKGDSVIAGLSGGADSCALVHILSRLAEKYELKITAVHINHGIRGSEADSDEAFAKAFCEHLGVDFVAYHCDIPALAKKSGMGEEEAGRTVRYEKFRETAERIHADKIAVAHNMNDSTETFVMNLCRGSGLKGLTGIKPVSGNIIRPVLYCSREEIENYCHENGIDYVTDSTNLCNDYTRNKVRNVLLPWLKENINPSADSNISHTAELLKDEEEFLAELAESSFKKHIIKNKDRLVQLNAEGLVAENRVIRRRVLRLALSSVRDDLKDMRRVHVETADDILLGETGRSADLPDGITVTKSYDILEIKKGSEKATGFCYEVIPNKIIHVAETGLNLLVTVNEKKIISNAVNICTKTADYDMIKDKLKLRTRQTGDYISIKGGNKKLKQLFIDEKIPSAERDCIPLLMDGNSAVTAFNRLGRDYYITDKTKNILYIYFWEDVLNG